jgi:hypothetical protein
MNTTILFEHVIFVTRYHRVVAQQCAKKNDRQKIATLNDYLTTNNQYWFDKVLRMYINCTLYSSLGYVKPTPFYSIPIAVPLWPQLSTMHL